MLDQAENLRQLALNKNKKDIVNEENKPKIITVTSGKGGVGKSNIVVNLAIVLQKMGKKVLIFDADLGMGNDDILLGTISKYTIFDIVFKNKTIDEVLVDGPCGVKLLPAGTGISELENLKDEERNKILKEIETIGEFDYIFMDTGAGINRNVLAFISLSDEMVVVTTPEPTSLTDAYGLIKVVNHYNLKKEVNIIINKAEHSKEALNTYNRISNVINKFLNMKVKNLGFLREDIKVSTSVKKQQPFTIKYPESSANKDIEKIASNILGNKVNNKNSSLKGVFRKLFGVFS